jgi:hypothetical protein
MKRIIISVFSALLSLSTIAAAEEKAANPPNIEAIKQQIVQSIDKSLEAEKQLRDKQLAIVGQFRSCIQAAKSVEDLNACNNAKNDSLNKLRLEVEKANLESKKKEIANEEKRLNEEGKK